MVDYKVAVIGLGSMGWGAAVSLLKAGIQTNGVDIRQEVLQQFTKEGGNSFKSTKEAIQEVDVVFLFVVNEKQIRDILFGEINPLSTCRKGTIFCLCSTMQPSSTVNIASKLMTNGMRVLDTPVSGGSAKALKGEITIIGSGKDTVFKNIEPILDIIASKVFQLSEEIGVGSKIKMINQLLAGVHISATAEALSLSTKLGLDLSMVYDVITQSAGNSWMFENRGAHIRDGDYTPHSMVDIFVKDLNIVKSEAKNFPTPLTETALNLFQEASDLGLGKEDDSAVAKVLAKKGGVRLPTKKQV